MLYYGSKNRLTVQKRWTNICPKVYNLANPKKVKLKEKFIMAHKITNDCIACGGCQSVCPCDAISEGDGKYEINPDLCVDCGACSAQCPVGAIEEE